MAMPSSMIGVIEGIVVDAVANIYVYVTDRDVQCATPKDPCQCAVAQAIKRMVGDDEVDVYIKPTTAVVKMPLDKDTKMAPRNSDYRKELEIGDIVWHRFIIKKQLRAEIEAFDEDGIAMPGAYIFKAPLESETLKHKRENNYKIKRAPKKNRGKYATIAKRSDPWKRALVRIPPKKKGNDKD